MEDNSQADIDGDGEFDGIDISIMEEDRHYKRPAGGNIGCSVAFLALGSIIIAAGWWGVNNYLI